MKKDFTRDYVTEAFRLYAAMGKPTYEDAKATIYKAELMNYKSFDPATAVQQAEIAVEKKEPMLLDILAVDKTIELLERGEKPHIIAAVKAVYFAYPQQPIRKGDISDRVRHFALLCPTDERTVYRWLKEARLLCAAIRGLRIRDADIKKYHIAL
jgi:hypothetical protein